MQKKNVLAGVISTALVAQSTIALAQPQSCQHVSGTWDSVSGSEQGVMQVVQSLGGSLVGYAHPEGCPPSWPIQGTWNGNGVFSLTATNPVPDGGCVPWVSMGGQVLAPNCDVAQGTGSNPFGGGYAVTMTKACDVPIGETSSFTGWGDFWHWPPIPNTIGKWQGTVIGYPGYLSLGGREVTETQIQAGTDSCYYPGALAGSPQINLTGGFWYVQVDNTWEADYIGWGPAIIGDYRDHYGPGIDCGNWIPQTMVVSCSGSDQPYSTKSVGFWITDTTIISMRGSTAWKQW